MAQKKSLREQVANHGKPIKCMLGILVAVPIITTDRNKNATQQIFNDIDAGFSKAISKSGNVGKIISTKGTKGINRIEKGQINRIASGKAKEAKDAFKGMMTELFGSYVSAGNGAGLSLEGYKDRFSKSFEALEQELVNPEAIVINFVDIEYDIQPKKPETEPGQMAAREIYDSHIQNTGGKFVFKENTDIAKGIAQRLGTDVSEVQYFTSVVLLDERYV